MKNKVQKLRCVVKENGIYGLLYKTYTSFWNKFTQKNHIDESKIVYQLLKDKPCSAVMVDVGAHFGGTMKKFADKGWMVYAFEPDSKNLNKLTQNFGSYTNVKIDNRAVSDKINNGIILYSSPESSGISSLSNFHESHHPSEIVHVTTLESILCEYSIKHIDFLKIDTEGYDLFVLRGMPFSKIMPEVVVCEFEDLKTIPLGYSFVDLCNFLTNYQYKLIISEWYPIDQYGAQHEWRCFMKYPCKLNDGKSWGNIIAVKSDFYYDKLIKLCKLM